jgi:fumarate reductase subunit D
MRYKIDTIEPMWWGLFMAGAGVAGLFLPIHIVINGLLIPLGVVPQAEVANRLATLMASPIVKLWRSSVTARRSSARSTPSTPCSESSQIDPVLS